MFGAAVVLCARRLRLRQAMPLRFSLSAHEIALARYLNFLCEDVEHAGTIILLLQSLEHVRNPTDATGASSSLRDRTGRAPACALDA